LLAARRKTVRVRVVLVGAAVFGVTEAICGLMPSYGWYALALPPAGMAALTTMTAANATLQLAVTPAMRGRVMALYLMVFAGGTPIGAPIIGWMADHYGPRWSLIFGGAITCTAALVASALLARRASMTVQAHLRPVPHLHLVPAPTDVMAQP
jgi:MFS family permease